LKAQINKTDRNDARGIAQMMRAGLYRPVQAPNSAGKIRTLVGRQALEIEFLKGALKNAPR